MTSVEERRIRAGQLSVDDIGKQVRIKVAEKTWVIGPLVNIHNTTRDKKTVVAVQINGVENIAERTSIYWSPNRSFQLGLKDEVTMYE